MAKTKRVDLTKTLVSGDKCKRCVFRFGSEEGLHLCNYFEIKGHSRTSLHPEGLTSVCHEFQPRQRKHRYQAEIK